MHKVEMQVKIEAHICESDSKTASVPFSEADSVLI